MSQSPLANVLRETKTDDALRHTMVRETKRCPAPYQYETRSLYTFRSEASREARTTVLLFASTQGYTLSIRNEAAKGQGFLFDTESKLVGVMIKSKTRLHKYCASS